MGPGIRVGTSGADGGITPQGRSRGGDFKGSEMRSQPSINHRTFVARRSQRLSRPARPARFEIRLIFEELLRRYDGFEIARELVWIRNNRLFSLERLPIRVSPAT